MLFLGKRNSSNKRRVGTAALIRGRRLITFLAQMRRLVEGGTYMGTALIPVNTVMSWLNRVRSRGGGVLYMLT